MKVLLVGEYSNVYNTLAQGLRKIGHQVRVASAGDGWKNYERDINLKAKSSKKQLLKIISKLNQFIGYEVVQVTNPFFAFSGSNSDFLNSYFFLFLNCFNRNIFLSAMGDDYYWTKACLNNKFKYSSLQALSEHKEFNSIGRNALSYLDDHVRKMNQNFASQSKSIIANLYEYHASYEVSEFKEKLKFIPFPINIDEISCRINGVSKNDKIKIFLGIQKKRSIWKGTDFILPILENFALQYPKDIELIKVESVAYKEYLKLMDKSDVVIDQLYSYSPAMNALTAMAQGKIVMTGGEPEMYNLLEEKNNFPIINIRPDKQQIRNQIEMLLDKKSELNEMKYNSRKFIETHHDYKKVAQKYIDVWKNTK